LLKSPVRIPRLWRSEMKKEILILIRPAQSLLLIGVQSAFCTAPVLALGAEEDSRNSESKKVVVASGSGAKSTNKFAGGGHNSALSSYLIYVNEKVKRAWAPSLKASTVVIAFNIDSSGQITEPILEESIGGTLAEDVA
jgi:hypothetical protein